MKTCGYKTVRSPCDLISGHVEYETMTLCGESLCADECYTGWEYCAYCGKKFSTDDVIKEDE